MHSHLNPNLIGAALYCVFIVVGLIAMLIWLDGDSK